MTNPYLSVITILQWYLEIGINEIIGKEPANYYTTDYTLPLLPYQQLGTPHVINQQLVVSASTVDTISNSIYTVSDQIASISSLEELYSAIDSFQECSLRTKNSRTVFADGVPFAPLMVIGEAPGEEEDLQGKPFVGPSGRLLDKMLKSIDVSRNINCYITNVSPWRPLGNRKPTPFEVGVLLPFLIKHIILSRPKILLLVGGLAASAILSRNEGIMKVHGQWFMYSAESFVPIPSLAIFHPAYLLRSPTQKKYAWRDLLIIKDKLKSI